MSNKHGPGHGQGAGGKRRREAEEQGTRAQGGAAVAATGPRALPPASSRPGPSPNNHNNTKQERPGHGTSEDGAGNAPAQKPKTKSKKRHNHKKKAAAAAPALAPPPPKRGAVAASLVAGSNWAQLRAKLAAAEADGDGGRKERGFGGAHRHHPNAPNRRPTLNELAGQQKRRRQQAGRGGEEDGDEEGGEGAAGDPTKKKKNQKRELRPITALTAAPLPGPIPTGASAAWAAAAAAGAGGVAAAAAAVTTTTTAAAAASAAAAARALLTPVVAIDCEMVGVGPDGKRSALARVCLVNDQGAVVLDTFVAPNEPVTDYRTWVSGVRAEDLRGAPALDEVQRRVAALVAGRVLVGHSLSGDLRCLLLSHPRKLVRDTARYPPLMRRAHRAPEGAAAAVAAEIARGRRRPKALRVLAAQELGLDIQSGEHTPVDDARAALYLYLHHAREWERAIRRGEVARLPVGVGGGAAGVAAAVAAGKQARALKQLQRKGKGDGGAGGGVAARSNTLDVRELSRQDPFADL